MAQSAEQQRRWERRAPTHPVRVSAETEILATAAGEALNLSDGGACLALQTSDLSVGDEVILWLSFERSSHRGAGHRPHRLGGRQLGPAPLRRPVDAPGPAAVLDRLAGEGLADQCLSSRRFMLTREMNWPPSTLFSTCCAISCGLARGGATWPAKIVDCRAPGRSMT